MGMILVTGGAGFIGSAFVRHHLSANPGSTVRVLDKLTYAGRKENLEGVERCELIVGDIADPPAVAAAIEGCDALVNFAAESHVDRSIESPGEFIQTDVYGTFVLLEAARQAGIRHLQISTDEVYGSIAEGSFTESSPLEPVLALLRVEGGGRPVGGRLPAHLLLRGADRPRLEQLRSATASGKADSALHPERAGGRLRCPSTAMGCRCATGFGLTTSRRRSTLS